MKTLVYSSEGLLGDSLCTLPAIYEYSKNNKFDLFLSNIHVRKIFIENDNINLLDIEPNKQNYDNVIETNVGKLFGGSVWKEHMIQSHFKEFNLQTPIIPTRPNIKIQRSDLKYDFLISPFSASGVGVKDWNVNNWNIVISELKNYGSIAVLGSKHYNNEQHGFVDVDFLFDYPLGELAYIIKNSKLTITIDNGISHLTYAAEGKHLLLYPKCLPEVWVRNPNATILHGIPNSLSVEQVLTTIKSLI